MSEEYDDGGISGTGSIRRKSIVIPIIRVYRKWISPLKQTPCCRFYPTCSAYALEAIEKYGILKGSYLSIKRILKCNPFNRGGFDPVK